MILLVRTEGPRHGRKRWLSEITFLVLTPGPWVVMIWLVWPRRSGRPRSPMMATADSRRLGRHMPQARQGSSVTSLKSKGFSRGHQNAIALSLADRL